MLKILEDILKWIMYGDLTNPNVLFYQMARTFLGRDASPSDEAPDELGCVDTVEEIYQALFGVYIAGHKTLSTTVLYKKLNASPLWERTATPEEGSIIISPSGYSTKGYTHGHVGIVGENNIIMSNSSFPPNKGMFLENFTVDSWKRYYRAALGFPVYYFRRKA